jgi:hypothetical protein
LCPIGIGCDVYYKPSKYYTGLTKKLLGYETKNTHPKRVSNKIMSGAAAASSAYDNDASHRVPSYQESQAGPWGGTLNGQIEQTAKLNMPFDQLQYENAKQNGCIPPPCKPYPVWPPPMGTGFIYPTLEKTQQSTLYGEEKGCWPMAAPFVDQNPVLPSVNYYEDVNGKQYSPQNILDMYDCMNTPQPINNQCFGYMPYDASYQASSIGQLGRYDGWLDKPLSAVPTTSVTQPLAVGVNVPSSVPSDRNPNQTAQPIPLPQPIPLSIPALTQPPQPFLRESFSNQPMKETIIQPVKPMVNQSTSNNPLTAGQATLIGPVSVATQPIIPIMPNMPAIPGVMPHPTHVSPNHTTHPTHVSPNHTAHPTSRSRSGMPYEEIVFVEPAADGSCCTRPEADRDWNLTCEEGLDWDTFFPCLTHSLRGTLRDLMAKKDAAHPCKTWNDIFVQHNRLFFWSIFIILVIIFHFVIRCVLLHARCPESSIKCVTYFYWIAVMVFLLYLAIPMHHTNRFAACKKITALLILGLVVWSFCMY